MSLSKKDLSSIKKLVQEIVFANNKLLRFEFATKDELKNLEERLIDVQGIVIDIKHKLDNEYVVMQRSIDNNRKDISKLKVRVNDLEQ